MNAAPNPSVLTKATKCSLVAVALFPCETTMAQDYASRLILKTDEEIDRLYQKYQFPALVGDLVEFRGEGGRVQTGQCLNHRDNQILLQVDKKDKAGYPHRSDAWAAKFLQAHPDKDLLWIHEKQINKVTRGTLDDRYDIVDRMIITRDMLDKDKWQEKILAAYERAAKNQSFDEYRNVVRAYLDDGQWPQEVIDTVLAISDAELSLIFQEAEALVQSLKDLDKDLAEFDREMSPTHLTSEAPDSIVSRSEEKNVPVVEVYKHESETHSKVTKEKTMSDKPGFLEMVKTDSGDAAYRVGAKQMTKAVKTATSNMLKSKGYKKSQINAIGEFLNTDFGEALISLALGTGLHYAPGISADPRAKKLAKEFRVEGMAVAGDVVASAAMEYLLPAVAGVIQQLPEENSKTRVEATANTAPTEEEAAEEEVVEAVRPAKARA